MTEQTHTDVEKLAHRIAWRYKKSSDPAHSDTYTFNRDTLLQFADALMAAERERCAQLLDAAHEQRKHIDNYAACYALMVREARLIEGPNVGANLPP